MKIVRVALAFVSLFLSLATSADYKSTQCDGCWLPSAAQPLATEGLGVNIHFTEAKPGELKMIADAGFRWVRMDFVWEVTERERGRYDFSAYDHLLKELEANNLRALFILDYGNSLYTDGKSVRTAEAQAAFARWSVAAAKHFAGRGVLWEIFNEPNVPLFWPPDPKADEYVSLAAEVSRAFRREVPNEKLIGPATSKIDLPFLESVFKASVSSNWAGVSVHPYRQADPESAAVEYARLRELISRYHPHNSEQSLPIISGEWGYSSIWRGMTDETQAAMLAREFLTNIANGIPLSIWYDWRDDGTDAKEIEHHFGLVRHQYQTGRAEVYDPKPAYLAAKTLTTQLNGYRFVERISAGNNGDYVLVFTKGSNRRMVAWTTSATSRRVTLAGVSGHFSITKLTGQPGGAISASNNALSIPLSTSPIYLAPAN
jgi:hypothetical protein